MSAVVKHRKKVIWLAVAGVVATFVFAGLNWRPIAARVVTWLAFRDAERLVAGPVTEKQFEETVVKPLAEKYGSWLRAGFFDREYFLERLPVEGVTAESLPAWGVVTAFYAAQGRRLNDLIGEDSLRAEIRTWAGPFLTRSSSKELLVNILTADHELFPSDNSYHEGRVKNEILAGLGLIREPSQVRSAYLDSFKEVHWQAILRDCDHPREKVRAGSLLLLYSHPSRALFLEKATKALGDPSRWVRLAAAGTLALCGNRAGEKDLVEGLSHERWEVRFWCGQGLQAIRRPKYAALIRQRALEEADSWLCHVFENIAIDILNVFPGTEWDRCLPADADMDATALQSFQSHVGGRGCVVRSGYMVHTWGDTAQRGDIASAAKPIYTYFLFKAIHDRRFGSIDDPVSRVEPGLLALNPALAHKDSKITWRHLANQVSCYGVTEEPGAAFDYSDFNIAFFFDTLFLKTYNVTRDELDKEVLHARLTDHLQCQDNPTFFAFGFDDRPGRAGISVRDFARFGLLYLRKGHWNEKQLIQEDEVTLATTSPLPNSIPRTEGKPAEMLPKQRSIGGGNNQTDHLGSYSFAWWTNGVDRDGKRHWPDAPVDAYGAFGHGGMRALVIIPSLDIVACWNDSPNEGREKESEALRLLVKAVVKP